MKPAVTMNIENLWSDDLPEPVRADKWHIEVIGPDPCDDVRLYFEAADGTFVRVDLVGETLRENSKSSEFAEDLSAATGFTPA